MKDKPIIFSAPMIRALLDGRKTQTRRILKDVPEAPAMDNIAWPDKKLHPAPYLDAYCGGPRTSENPRGMTENWAYWTRDDRPGPLFKVGYVPGDRLWVREKFAVSGIGWGKKPSKAIGGKVHFAADADHGWQSYWGNWNPSIHMPRWASRLTLVVTDVRVQRVQDITNADAVAEGIERLHDPNGFRDYLNDDPSARVAMNPSFRSLWDSINAKRGFGWDANPWVVALTFDVHKCNIDQLEIANA